MAENKNGFLGKLSGLFGGNKTTVAPAPGAANAQGGGLNDILNMGKQLMGSEMGNQLLSQLGNIKSLDTNQIQTVLGALSQSPDTQVQAAKNDLQAVQHDGVSFVEKLKGYATTLAPMLPALLPALKQIFSGQKA